jgi:hypothetical protein
MPTPQIDDHAAIDHHAHRRADLAPLGEVALELFTDQAKRRIDRALQVCSRDKR